MSSASAPSGRRESTVASSSNEAPPELADAIDSDPVESSADKIDRARTAVAELRSLDLLLADLEDQKQQKLKRRHELVNRVLVDLFDEAGVDHVGLPPKGNLPAYDVRLSTQYAANIAAGWPEERRREAFAALDSLGAGDLVKVQVSLAFPRGDREKADELLSDLASRGLDAQVKNSVHSGTLSAWLREQVEAGRHIPLEKIGGFVGRVATVKVRRPV